MSGYPNEVGISEAKPAVNAAYARRLNIFKFFVSVCPIFPNILSLSSETVQNDLNMVD